MPVVQSHWPSHRRFIAGVLVATLVTFPVIHIWLMYEQHVSSKHAANVFLLLETTVLALLAMAAFGVAFTITERLGEAMHLFWVWKTLIATVIPALFASLFFSAVALPDFLALWHGPRGTGASHILNFVMFGLYVAFQAAVVILPGGLLGGIVFFRPAKGSRA